MHNGTVFVLSVALTSVLLVFLSRDSDSTTISAKNGANKRPRVVLLALDGLRPDFVTASNMPFTHGLFKSSVIAPGGVKPEIWTYTAVNFASMSTGLHADAHGIVANEFWDPNFKTYYDYWNSTHNTEYINNARQARFYSGTPIWQVVGADESGAVYWPTCDVAYNGVVLARCVPAPMDLHTWGPEHWHRNVHQLIEWMLDEHKPIRLAMMYVPEPDAAEHAHDIFSQPIKQMLKDVDDLVKYLFAKLEENDLLDETNVIITTDHGHTNVIAPFNLIRFDKLFAEAKPPIKYIRSQNGLFAHEDTTVEQLYSVLAKFQSEYPNFDVWKQEDIPQSFHYQHNRTGHVLVLEKLGYHAVFEHRPDNPEPRVYGKHGYSNQYPEMRGFFLAHGAAFKEGMSLPMNASLDVIDMYPLLCHILHISPNKCDQHQAHFTHVARMFK